MHTQKIYSALELLQERSRDIRGCVLKIVVSRVVELGLRLRFNDKVHGRRPARA